MTKFGECQSFQPGHVIRLRLRGESPWHRHQSQFEANTLCNLIQGQAGGNERAGPDIEHVPSIELPPTKPRCQTSRCRRKPRKHDWEITCRYFVHGVTRNRICQLSCCAHLQRASDFTCTMGLHLICKAKRNRVSCSGKVYTLYGVRA